MADSKIKKVVISKDDFPPIGPNNNYIVRYRIVSEDKNRVSHWSQTYNLQAHAAVPVAGSIEVTAKTVVVVWKDAATYSDKEAYDVFSKVDNGAWTFMGTVYVHAFTMLRPEGSSISIAIQNEAYIKERNSTLTIFEDTEPMV